MNVSLRIIASAGLAAAIALALPTTSFSKAHDNGVADGSPSGNASVGGQTAGQGGNGVSGAVSGGERGDAASTAGSDNAGGKGNSDGSQSVDPRN